MRLRTLPKKLDHYSFLAIKAECERDIVEWVRHNNLYFLTCSVQV